MCLDLYKEDLVWLEKVDLILVDPLQKENLLSPFYPSEVNLPFFLALKVEELVLIDFVQQEKVSLVLFDLYSVLNRSSLLVLVELS